jgi:hypothetical protein
MPDGIKYSTTVQTNSLQKGNVAIGVGSVGPTSTTNFYSAPIPASGKYIVSRVAASGVPNFFAPSDEAEMIKLARQEGATGANTASLASCLAWFATQTNYSVANFDYENIVTDGLVLNLDAGFVSSYPTTGTTWYDIGGNSFENYSQSGNVGFNNNGYFTFGGSNTGNFNGTPPNITSEFTLGCWFRLTGPLSGGTPTMLRTNPLGFLMEFGDTGTNKMAFYCVTNQGAVSVHSDTLNENVWYYGTGTIKSADSIKAYINGSQIVTNSIGSATFSVSNYTFYAGYNQGEFYTGDIAIVQLYDRALSASEILQNYNAQKGRFGL